MSVNTDRLLLELRRARRPFLVTVVFFLAGLIAFGLIFRNLTYKRPWESYREVRVEFDDVKGIFPGGHQVRISGVKAGLVTKAAVEDGRAILTLQIEDKFGPIYRNARMRIRPVTPLDDLYVNITDRGDKSAGEAGKDYVIAAEQTVTPVDISRVLDTFNADTRKRLTILLSELGRGLDDGGVRLRASFAELAPFLHVAEDATRVLARRERSVRRIVHNFRSLSAALAKRDDELNTLVREGNATLGELAANDRPLGATLVGLADLLPVMRSSFGSVRNLSGALDPALRSLGPVASELERGLGGLERFGRDARPALQALRPALRDLRGMTQTLSPTARSLSTAFGRLSPQAPQYDRITREIVPCLDTAQQFFQHTLSVFKFQDAHGAFPRAEMTVDSDGGAKGGFGGLSTKPVPTCVDGGGG